MLVVSLEVWMDIETWMVFPILPVFTQIGGYLIVLSHWLWISCGIINIVLRHGETALFDLDGDGKINANEQVALDRHKAMTCKYHARAHIYTYINICVYVYVCVHTCC